MLTLEELKNMKPRTIFATGMAFDSPEGLNMTGSGELLRWVAVRGGICDWCIYTHFATHDAEWIYHNGDKVISETNIRMFVPCDNEAFKMYRY